MKKNTGKIQLIFLLTTIININIAAQNTTEEVYLSNFRKIFLEYESPSTPEEFKKAVKNAPFQSVYIIALVKFNKEGIVDTIICNRLYDVGNKFNRSATIWDHCERSIFKAASKWKVKPLLWPNQKSDKEVIPPPGRPNYGMQNHLIIFEFFDSFEARMVDKLYQILAR